MSAVQERIDTGGTDGPMTPRWTWLATLGLVMAALAPLLMLGSGALWGLSVGEEVSFFGVTGLVGLIAAFLVWRFGTWAKVVGAVVAFLLMGALFWTAFGLFAPNSFFDFVPGLLVIPGGLIAIVACIASIVAARRGSLSERPIGGERRGIRIVLGVIIVLAVVSAALTFTGRATVEGGVGAVTVRTTDFTFRPNHVEISGGEQIVVRNDDPFLHTFTIDELDIDVTLSPGSEELVTIPEEAGGYTFYCEPHTSDPENPSEDDMAGHIEIR